MLNFTVSVLSIHSSIHPSFRCLPLFAFPVWLIYPLCSHNLLRSLFLSEEYVFIHSFFFLFNADYIVVESHLVHARFRQVMSPA